jgi:two-component system, OmpR family, phosphate regulon sensor histidine kinase PhoR
VPRLAAGFMKGRRGVIAVAAALVAGSSAAVLLAHAHALLPLAVIPSALGLLWARTAVRNRALADQNRQKDDFVAMVAHELRTPLTSIQGSVKTMLRLGPGMDEELRREFLETVDRQSDRLRRLVDRLLFLQQIEGGTDPATFTQVPLHALCEYVVLELRPKAGAHDFRFDFEPELIDIETDEVKLQEILTNLIENALKYSDPDCTITIRCRAAAETLVLWVEDRGPGIPKDLRERAFDRYFRVEGTSRTAKGTGLGLYICRRLAQTIGGEIWLDDAYDGGCRFFLRLPRTHASAGLSEDIAIRQDPVIAVGS